MNAFSTRDRIMVVSPDAILRNELSSALGTRGLGSLHAASLSEASPLLSEERCAIVLLDVSARDAEAELAASNLARNSRENGTIVLLLAEPETAVETFAVAVHGVFRKPIDVIELATLLESCVDIRIRTMLDTMSVAALLGPSLLALLTHH